MGTISLTPSATKSTSNAMLMKLPTRASDFESLFTTKGHGTGLGLPICRRIVEAHDAAIYIEEGDGSGGVVTIALPGPIRSSEFQAAAYSVTQPC